MAYTSKIDKHRKALCRRNMRAMSFVTMPNFKAPGLRVPPPSVDLTHSARPKFRAQTMARTGPRRDSDVAGLGIAQVPLALAMRLESHGRNFVGQM